MILDFQFCERDQTHLVCTCRGGGRVQQDSGIHLSSCKLQVSTAMTTGLVIVIRRKSEVFKLFLKGEEATYGRTARKTRESDGNDTKPRRIG